MQPTLYAHPFSSYCQKVLIALYENATPFTYRVIGPDDPEAVSEWAALWPLKRMPVLVDDGKSVLESTSIIEYLALHYPGENKLLPECPEAALEARMMDRVFDNYIMTPMQKIVLDHLRPESDRDSYGVRQAREMLSTAYDWLDKRLDGQEWATGAAFTLADCAAAPSLFYADWVHEIGATRLRLSAYRARLLARPSNYALGLGQPPLAIPASIGLLFAKPALSNPIPELASVTLPFSSWKAHQKSLLSSDGIIPPHPLTCFVGAEK